MKIKITSRWDDTKILCGEYKSIKDCLEKNKSANLRGSDLSGSDLSGVKNLVSTKDFLDKNFKKLKNGLYIGYKAKSPFKDSPYYWKWEKGSILRENVNFYRTEDCGCGVNIATIGWINENVINDKEVWLVHFDPAGAIVPYNTDGKIRVEWCKLIKIVREENEKS